MKIDYLNPKVPKVLPWHPVPMVKATAKSLKGYGRLVRPRELAGYPVEVVRWPASGWRHVDKGTGDEAGTVSGDFEFYWEGDFFRGRNHALGSEYLFGWSKNPVDARPESTERPRQVLLWHANYHPDGGQLFFPRNGESFVTALALPGDYVQPNRFVAFLVEGGNGLYIHPNVWHEAIVPLAPSATFYDEQGAVHARVSVNLPEEFGVFLAVPIPR
ncbi:MAG: ureidoglycolate lyase [Flavobacteriales bacterium]|nr:ureidoglycolate lyase [Flavobacteriales bacterium]